MNKIINLKHHEIDFLNLDTTTDTKLFIDPTKLYSNNLHPIFGKAYQKVAHFFRTAFKLYQQNNQAKLKELFSHSQECNYIHLGLSKGKSLGKGASQEMLLKFFELVSKADDNSRKNLLTPTALSILSPKFAEDRTSDLLVSLLKKEIVEYTLEQARIHGIPISTKNYNFGEYWNSDSESWENLESPYILGADNQPLLLLPKVLITKRYHFQVIKFIRTIIFVPYKEKLAGTFGYHKNGKAKPVPNRYLEQELIKNRYLDSKSKYKQFAQDELSKNPRQFDSFYTNITQFTNSSILSDDELDELTK